MLGKNGAGRSTLISLVAGTFPRTEGGCRIGGTDVPALTPQRAREAGVAAVFQEFSPAPDLTVVENLFLGLELSRAFMLREAEMKQRATRFFDDLRCHVDLDASVGGLSRAQKQLVGIAKRLRAEAKIHAKNAFKEGLHFLCVRMAENDQEKQDILRVGMMRNRVPGLWLGDVRAQIGACRTGERRIGELLDRYGRGAVLDFVEDWFDHGARLVAAEIAKLPKKAYSHEARRDPVPGVVDEGASVRITVMVDPEAGEITVGVRDNIDDVPGGLNLSENTATDSCRISVSNNLPDDLSYNEGAKSRNEVLLREGCLVDKPHYPIGTSVCQPASACSRIETPPRKAPLTFIIFSSAMQATARGTATMAGSPIAGRPTAVSSNSIRSRSTRASTPSSPSVGEATPTRKASASARAHRQWTAFSTPSITT